MLLNWTVKAEFCEDLSISIPHVPITSNILTSSSSSSLTRTGIRGPTACGSSSESSDIVMAESVVVCNLFRDLLPVGHL